MTDITQDPASTFASPPEEDVQVDFAIYDVSTGKVRITGHCPYSMLILQSRTAEEGVVLEWLNNATCYVDVSVDPPVGRARPLLAGFDTSSIKANAIDAATLNLPLPAIVRVDGVEHRCPSGPMIFTADSPGTYTFEVTSFPYLDFTAKVIAS